MLVNVSICSRVNNSMTLRPNVSFSAQIVNAVSALSNPPARVKGCLPRVTRTRSFISIPQASQCLVVHWFDFLMLGLYSSISFWFSICRAVRVVFMFTSENGARTLLEGTLFSSFLQ